MLRDGQELTIPSSDVQVDDIVVLKPGDKVAVDGEVTEGETSIDEALVTGESVPVTKRPGDLVIAVPGGRQGTMTARGTLAARSADHRRRAGSGGCWRCYFPGGLGARTRGRSAWETGFSPGTQPRSSNERSIVRDCAINQRRIPEAALIPQREFERVRH